MQQSEERDRRDDRGRKAASMNQRIGTPAAKITTTAPKVMASAVPRSGCSMTSPAGRASKASAGTSARQLAVMVGGRLS
jgi:hypothetical protein